MKQASSLSLWILFLLLFVYSTGNQGCSKYTVTITENNPADASFKKAIVTSTWWGKVNKPQRLVDSCGNAGLDEIKITTNVGYSLLHIVTLGFLNKMKVEWKCHQPCTRVGFQP